MRSYFHLTFMLLSFLQGCGLDDLSEQPLNSGETINETEFDGVFDAPQGVVFTSEWVVVTNTAYRPVTLDFGSGSITLISRADRQVTRQIPVSAPNPQKVLVVGDALYVLCTGQTRFDQESWLNIAQGPGALDRFDLENLADATGPTDSLTLPVGENDPREGGFGSMVATEDGKTLVIASGLKALLWAVDLETMTWKRGPDNPLIPYEHEYNDTLTVSSGDSKEILVSSFNKDRVHALDTDTLTWSSDPPVNMGENEDLEGLLQTLFLPDGSLLGLLTIANGLYQTSPDRSTGNVTATVGPIANHMAVQDNTAFVVNSGVNNLVRVQLDTGTVDAPFSVFPVGSNPWEIALEPEGGLAVVTLNQTHQIAWINLETGELLEIIP